MKCTNCGAETGAGAVYCPACGRALNPPPPAAAASDPVNLLAREVKAAAKDLAIASAKLSKSLAKEAGRAAEDPKGTAKRVAKRVAADLEKASQQIEQALRDL